MKFDCDIIKQAAKEFSLVGNCDVVRDGSLRMATPFLYPDGSNIDLFAKDPGGLFQEIELSDKGQTAAYLLDLHVKLWTTRKRKQMVADICKTLGVEQDGGAFVIRVPVAKVETLPQEMVRLAQACIRVTDIAFTQRFRSPVLFDEEVEEFIATIDRPYSQGVKIPGKYQKQVEFDYLVSGQKSKSLIQTISTSNQGAAHNLVNEIFRKWWDIEPERPNYNAITIFDTNSDVFREDDIARLSEVSMVIGFPADYARLKLLLAA